MDKPLRTHDEFPDGAATWPRQIDRRKFLKLSAGVAAMASLSGCFKQSREAVAAEPEGPPSDLDGYRRRDFATAMAWQGYARGILASCHRDRPVKLAGNPDHPASLGSTDPIVEGSLIELYHPERARGPTRKGEALSWEAFERDLAARMAGRADKGAGVWIVLQPDTSVYRMALLRKVLEQYPGAHLVWHPLASRYHDAGWVYDFDKADHVLGVGADFLTDHPMSLAYARAYMRRRRGWDDGVRMNQFVQLDTVPTLTGAQADRAFPVSPADRDDLLRKIEARSQDLPKPLAALLAAARPGRSLVVAGAHEPRHVHEWALRMNAALGNVGETVKPVPRVRSDDVIGDGDSIDDLRAALDAGEVDVLVNLDCDLQPFISYDADWVQSLRKARFSVAWTLYKTPATDTFTWHLPAAHYLEAWGDLRAWTGELTIRQPAVLPLYDSRPETALLSALVGNTVTDAHTDLQAFWQGHYNGSNFKEDWWQGLKKGILPDAFAIPGEASAPAPESAPAAPQGGSTQGAAGEGFVLFLRPDPGILHGERRHNPWLQEMPNPIAKMSWGNALWIHPDDAKAHGLHTPDSVEISVGGRTMRAGVWECPTMPRGSLMLYTGHGMAGTDTAGNNVGANAYLIWKPGTDAELQGATLRKVDGGTRLIRAQAYFDIHSGDEVFAKTQRVDEPVEKEPGQEGQYEPPSLYSLPDENFAHTNGQPVPDHKWGMSIDLSSCFGCSACVIACQAENNIPTVGPDMVDISREMLWLLVDRYFHHEGDRVRIVHQPRPCMQCEKAPCEVVCPVQATVHGQEGLNQMIYNRCVGTRYCSNNCPYKVRRFNFLNYRPAKGDTRELQNNPEVTVREQGVMEKCTYCIQRINKAKILARDQRRKIRTDEIKTACQQACPSHAIIFGDILDKDSELMRRKRHKADYTLLAELDTRPRTTFLPKYINPLPGEQKEHVREKQT